jgi:all-trans-retinol 13,14-reductase
MRNILPYSDVVSVYIEAQGAQIVMKTTGHAWKQSKIADRWDAIVVGSGMGGLTAAAMLARHGGRRVLVLERHYTAGGFTHAFQRPGYEWDAGVHYIGGVNDPASPMRSAFDHVTEGRLQWAAVPDVYDRISIGRRDYDFPSGTERLRDRLIADFPGDKDAIDRYFAIVEATVRASGRYWAEKAIPEPAARLVGGLLRSGFLKFASRTTAQVLASLTRNRELTAVLTGQWGDYGLPPAQSSFGAHAIVAQHYFEGAGYPIGGASEIAASIAPAIERAGGEIIYSAEVAGILLEQNQKAIGVRMADGRELFAKTIVSDAGAANTFQRLLPAGLAACSGMVEALKTVPPSVAHVCLYVGVKRATGEREFDATNRWIYRDADHDGNFARFWQDPGGDWPCLFISFPSAKDPTFDARYPGRSTMEVIAPVPFAPFAKWADTRWRKRGADYDRFKLDLTHRLRADLERHVPALRGRIDYAELSTPLSTRHFANFEHGEIYGLGATPARFQLRSLGVRTPVRNLYLTGADACSSGIAGAMMGGVMAASVVLRRNLMGKLSGAQTRAQAA